MAVKPTKIYTVQRKICVYCGGILKKSGFGRQNERRYQCQSCGKNSAEYNIIDDSMMNISEFMDNNLYLDFKIKKVKYDTLRNIIKNIVTKYAPHLIFDVKKYNGNNHGLMRGTIYFNAKELIKYVKKNTPYMLIKEYDKGIKKYGIRYWENGTASDIRSSYIYFLCNTINCECSICPQKLIGCKIGSKIKEWKRKGWHIPKITLFQYDYAYIEEAKYNPSKAEEIIVIPIPRDGKGKTRGKNIEFYKENNCWICTSHIAKNGSPARIKIGDINTTVSRLIYSKAFGSISDDVKIIKSCHNEHCINPEHMRIVDKYHNRKNRKLSR